MLKSQFSSFLPNILHFVCGFLRGNLPFFLFQYLALTPNPAYSTARVSLVQQYRMAMGDVPSFLIFLFYIQATIANSYDTFYCLQITFFSPSSALKPVLVETKFLVERMVDQIINEVKRSMKVKCRKTENCYILLKKKG